MPTFLPQVRAIREFAVNTKWRAFRLTSRSAGEENGCLWSCCSGAGRADPFFNFAQGQPYLERILTAVFLLKIRDKLRPGFLRIGVEQEILVRILCRPVFHGSRARSSLTT